MPHVQGSATDDEAVVALLNRIGCSSRLFHPTRCSEVQWGHRVALSEMGEKQ
jgi:hypothetical protein